MNQRYLTTAQVASYTGFHPVTVVRWAEAGKWGKKQGRVWRFDKEQVDSFMGGGK